MAVKGQSTAVVEQILQANSMVLNERDKKGNTALHMATQKARSQDVMFGGCSSSEDVADIDTYVSQNPTDTFYMGSAHMQLTSDSVGEWHKHPKPIFGRLFANSTCLHGKIYNMGFRDLDPQLFDPTSDSWESITVPSELQCCLLSMFALPDPSHDRIIILHLETGSL
ncbi:ankyrin repeat-containing protein [Trifolium pratense]|uniref:Ankyrin repeat-containing protein n=1 Tax=Trifolium pratense TaxID=57577 RepID=A0A2K3LXB8_TRIPR|nr:ankyrin repeat-containing protein [Trifolium pratense]